MHINERTEKAEHVRVATVTRSCSARNTIELRALHERVTAYASKN